MGSVPSLRMVSAAFSALRLIPRRSSQSVQYGQVGSCLLEILFQVAAERR